MSVDGGGRGGPAVHRGVHRRPPPLNPPLVAVTVDHGNSMPNSGHSAVNIFNGLLVFLIKICINLHLIENKIKSSMARSLPVENLLPQNVGSIINYLQYTEAAQWGTPSCSQPQPATDNGVRDGRSN